MARGTTAYYLVRLRSFARARGGEVLSRKYVNDFTKLRYRCRQGHEWVAEPGKIKQGRWCPACGRARAASARKAPAIARLHRIVARRGGVIVSPRYVNSQTKLRYRCRNGHVWEAVPNSLLHQGTWCPRCSIRHQMMHQHAERKRRVLRRIQRIARRRGGEVLSPTFVHSKVHLRFRCARGHSWETLPDCIDKGAWCPACKAESLLARLRELAERWGGECLAAGCRSGRDRLEWRCAQGHQWKAPAAQIKRGIWCPKCRLPRPDNIERMRRIAVERGGECLSQEYVNTFTRLRWRCGEGHEWKATPGAIIQGTWCRICERGQGHSRARLNIEIMRQMAAARGGACLSAGYEGIYDRLRWRCARGHTWVTAANNVRRGGWCPVCAHSACGTLDGMRALATARGGRCLTRTWNNHRQPLLFECGRGHRFRVRANVVKSGVWCPTCRR